MSNVVNGANTGLDLTYYEFSFIDSEFGKKVRLNPSISNKEELEKIQKNLIKLRTRFKDLKVLTFRDLEISFDTLETIEDKLHTFEAYSQLENQDKVEKAIVNQEELISRELKEYFFQAYRTDPLIAGLLRFREIFPEFEYLFLSGCYIPEQLLFGSLSKKDYMQYLIGFKPFLYFERGEKKKTKLIPSYLISEKEIELIRNQIKKRKSIPFCLEKELINTWIEDMSTVSFTDRFRFNEKNPCPYQNLIGSLNKLEHSYTNGFPMPTKTEQIKSKL